MQARWGTHGDHPVIALIPNSVRETFVLTVRAFNLSEKYRVPIILLLDEIVGHVNEKVTLPEKDEIEVWRRETPDVSPENFLPYKHTISDIPPMVSFGEGYRFHVTGLVHDETGFPTNNPEDIDKFLRRLNRKIERHTNNIIQNVIDYEDGAKVGVFAYGSTSRSAKQAIAMAREKGIKAGLLHLVTLSPFPRRDVVATIRDVRAVLVPEMNIGQISREVKRVNEGMSRVTTLNRIDGRMITPQQIYERLVKE